jgi:hypothetical protein
VQHIAQIFSLLRTKQFMHARQRTHWVLLQNTIMPLLLKWRSRYLSLRLVREDIVPSRRNGLKLSLRRISGLANISLPGAALLDPFVTYTAHSIPCLLRNLLAFSYNKLDKDGLQEITPNLSWDAFFVGIDATITQINVQVIDSSVLLLVFANSEIVRQAPSFFSNLSSWIVKSDPKTWAPYLLWQVSRSFSQK